MPARTINNIGGESSRKRPRHAVSFEDEGDEDQVVEVRTARSALKGDTTVCIPI